MSLFIFLKLKRNISNILSTSWRFGGLFLISSEDWAVRPALTTRGVVVFIFPTQQITTSLPPPSLDFNKNESSWLNTLWTKPVLDIAFFSFPLTLPPHCVIPPETPFVVLHSTQWQKTMLLSVILVPSVLFPVVFFINLLASHYNTVNTIPFIAMLKMGLIWLFVSFPLGVVGSMFGRHWGGKASFPCRVNSIPRPIPEGAWWALERRRFVWWYIRRCAVLDVQVEVDVAWFWFLEWGDFMRE